MKGVDDGICGKYVEVSELRHAASKIGQTTNTSCAIGQCNLEFESDSLRCTSNAFFTWQVMRLIKIRFSQASVSEAKVRTPMACRRRFWNRTRSFVLTAFFRMCESIESSRIRRRETEVPKVWKERRHKR